MNILLKDLLREQTTATTTESPLKVQIYCDMDGVLVDMNKGFKKISGGYTAENLKDKFDGDIKTAQKEFWKLIGGEKNFWLNLEPMPDAKILWEFIKKNFVDPAPVVLSAGSGSTLAMQKEQWIRKHIDPRVKVMIAAKGTDKPKHIINHPSTEMQYVTHVLIDDTDRNISSWNNQELHRIAIHHKNAADTIKALEPFLPK